MCLFVGDVQTVFGLEAVRYGSRRRKDTGVLTVVSTTGQALTWTDPLTSTSELAFSSRVSKVYGMGAGPSTAQQLARAGNVTPIVDNQYGRGSEACNPLYREHIERTLPCAIVEPTDPHECDELVWLSSPSFPSSVWF